MNEKSFPQKRAVFYCTVIQMIYSVRLKQVKTFYGLEGRNLSGGLQCAIVV